MRRALALALCAAGAGCKDPPVTVAPEAKGADHGQAALVAAVSELTAHRSPAAFAAFRDRVYALRPDMDAAVAAEAELYAVSQALEVAQADPEATSGGEDLILTVWPLALAPTIAASIPGVSTEDLWSPWLPKAGEREGAYLERLCDGPALLARECRDVVPEGLAAVVGGEAIDRLADRMRRALVACLTCDDPAWAGKLAAWEELDREAQVGVRQARRRHDPTRWPMAGDGATPLPPGPLLVVTDDGALEVDGTEVLPHELDGQLRAARKGGGRALQLQVSPTARSERVRTVMTHAAAAGFGEVALVARGPHFPYPLVAYVVPSDARLPVGDGDPVQVLVRVLDFRARNR